MTNRIQREKAFQRSLTIWIPGVPAPKPAHKARVVQSKRGKAFAVHYQDAKSPGIRWENSVRELADKWVFDQANMTRPVFDGPVELRMLFVMPRSKSLPKSVVHHIKTPDAINIFKATEDGIKGILVRDDSQVVEPHARKEYAIRYFPAGVYDTEIRGVDGRWYEVTRDKKWITVTHRRGTGCLITVTPLDERVRPW